MSGLGNYGANMGANMGMSAGANVNPMVNSHAGAQCGPGYGYSSTGAILVLFILLVIISRTIYV